MAGFVGVATELAEPGMIGIGLVGAAFSGLAFLGRVDELVELLVVGGALGQRRAVELAPWQGLAVLEQDERLARAGIADGDARPAQVIGGSALGIDEIELTAELAGQ